MCRKIRVLTELILCLIVALADAACVSRSSPTIFAHACHKALTSWVCRLLGGGDSHIVHGFHPLYVRIDLEQKLGYSIRGQEVEQFCSIGKHMRADRVLSSFCLEGDLQQQLSAFEGLPLRCQSMRSCRAQRSVKRC